MYLLSDDSATDRDAVTRRNIEFLSFAPSVVRPFGRETWSEMTEDMKIGTENERANESEL